jgi:hypothetical protein
MAHGKRGGFSVPSGVVDVAAGHGLRATMPDAQATLEHQLRILRKPRAVVPASVTYVGVMAGVVAHRGFGQGKMAWC